jgi:hypothetical protein
MAAIVAIGAATRGADDVIDSRAACFRLIDCHVHLTF